MENFLYSPSKNGFYLQSLHGDAVPTDVVSLTPAAHSALFEAVATGKVIAAGSDGFPILLDPPEPTTDQIIEGKIAVVQGQLDASARALNFESIANAITYADEPAVPRFQAQGLAMRAWRSLVWARCYEILDDVRSGKIEMPSDNDLLAALPKLVLPDSA